MVYLSASFLSMTVGILIASEIDASLKNMNHNFVFFIATGFGMVSMIFASWIKQS